MYRNSILLEKLKEAAASVLPISLIVAGICFALVPVSTGLMLSFLIGSALLILGMGLFTLGAHMSMSRIGNYIGAALTRRRKLWLIVLLSFVLGAAITMAEPDLQVLAANVPDIDKTVLVFTVSAGVGIFLALCMLRIVFSISLRLMLILSYTIVFLGACFTGADFLSVAFDSGGVTTGPMTVPFIMALGVGVASIRSDENAKADSFGLVALCSVGPILSVMLLGLIYRPGSAGPPVMLCRIPPPSGAAPRSPSRRSAEGSAPPDAAAPGRQETVSAKPADRSKATAHRRRQAPRRWSAAPAASKALLAVLLFMVGSAGRFRPSALSTMVIRGLLLTPFESVPYWDEEMSLSLPTTFALTMPVEGLSLAFAILRIILIFSK